MNWLLAYLTIYFFLNFEWGREVTDRKAFLPYGLLFYAGEYLSVTGEKLNGVEMRLPLIEEQLGKLVTDNPSVIETTLEQIKQTIFEAAIKAATKEVATKVANGVRAHVVDKDFAPKNFKERDTGANKVQNIDNSNYNTSHPILSTNSNYNRSGIALQDLLMRKDVLEDERKTRTRSDLKGCRNDQALDHLRDVALSQSLFSAVMSLVVGITEWEAEDPCMPLVVALFTVDLEYFGDL
ncbi:3-hydroxyisobutyryl-CoA hydrolase-like protein 2, mitochondrial, partial [Mucuna pruriens]